MEIRNTADFLTVLDATIAEVDALVASEPDYPIWGALGKTSGTPIDFVVRLAETR